MEAEAAGSQGGSFARGAARLIGVIVTAWWLVLTYAIVRSDDPITVQAIVSLGLALPACLGLLAAWRWPQAGGAIALAAALVLGAVTAYYNSPPLGTAVLSTVPLVVPLLLAGALFLVSGGQRVRPMLVIVAGLLVVLLLVISAVVGLVVDVPRY